MTTEYNHTIRPLPWDETVSREDFANGKTYLAANPAKESWTNLEIETVPYMKDEGWFIVCKTEQTSEVLYSFLMHESYLSNHYKAAQPDNAWNVSECYRPAPAGKISSTGMLELV